MDRASTCIACAPGFDSRDISLFSGVRGWDQIKWNASILDFFKTSMGESRVRASRGKGDK